MNKIKQFRHKHNLSQRKLAELLLCNIRTIQRWESGERTPHPMMIKYLEKLDKELSSLIKEAV